MMNPEHLNRFWSICGKEQGSQHPLFRLNADRCMGIKLDIDEDDLIDFGLLKLKIRLSKVYLKVGTLYLSTRYLHLAMRVLHRRKYVHLGVLRMQGGYIFCLREGIYNVCIAPATPDDYQADAHDILDVVEPSAGILMQWIQLSPVFENKERKK